MSMITFNNACNIIKNKVSESNNSELIYSENSIGRVLYKDYASKQNVPRANLSSMDGVVVFKKEKNKILKITGESKAGDKLAKEFKSGECQLIYTGAPIYGENKRVIPKENFLIKDGYVYIESLPTSFFIREKGADLKKNRIYLKRKEVLSLRSIVLSKSMRLKTLRVKKKPKIFVICTGDEIISDNRKSSLIPSTNNIFIKNLVQIFGGQVIKTLFSRDNHDDFINKFNSQKNFDLLITSGGISRGKYDIVKSSLKKKGLKLIFDRVAIKPGKPTSFGTFSKNKYFLGLPGNPVSCFMSMINFFPIFVDSFYGIKSSKFLFKELISKEFVDKNKNLTLFERVVVKGDFFKIFKNQDSSMMHLLNKANGILIRKPFAKEIYPNQKVIIMLLNTFNTNEI